MGPSRREGEPLIRVGCTAILTPSLAVGWKPLIRGGGTPGIPSRPRRAGRKQAIRLARLWNRPRRAGRKQVIPLVVCPDVEPSPARGEETEAFLLVILCIRAVPGGEKTRLCRASPPLFAKSRPCPSLLRQRQDGSACEAGAETRPRRTGSGTGRKRGPPGRCRGKRRDACALRKEAGCVFRRQLLKTKRRMEMLSTMPTRAQFTTRAVPP